MLFRAARLHRQNLILRESVGLEGYWGKERKMATPDVFDKALLKLCEKAVVKDKREAEHGTAGGCATRLIAGINTFEHIQNAF